MAKFISIVLAYMISVSSALAATPTANAEGVIASLIANDQHLSSGDVRVVITKNANLVANAPASTIRVLSLKIDTKANNFFATMSANDSSPFEVNGKFEKMQRIPALARNIEKGQVIAADDITYIPVTDRQLRRDLVTTEENIIGKQASRMIPAGKPVVPSMLVAATVINKGASVVATYKSDALTIQNTVEAMEDGSVGETIRLKNVNSNKVIHGKVTGNNTVELLSGSQFASNE